MKYPYLHKARMLLAKAKDPATPLAEARTLYEQAGRMIAKYNLLDLRKQIAFDDVERTALRACTREQQESVEQGGRILMALGPLQTLFETEPLQPGADVVAKKIGKRAATTRLALRYLVNTGVIERTGRGYRLKSS